MLPTLRIARFWREQPRSFMRKAGRVSGGRLLNHDSHFGHGIGAGENSSTAMTNFNHSSLEMPYSTLPFTTPRLGGASSPQTNADLPDRLRTVWQDAP